MAFGVTGLFGTLPFVCSSNIVNTFKDVNRDLATKYARHDGIGRKPVLEWIGEESDKISFKIRFDSSLNSPPEAGLFLLKRMLDSHKPQRLLLGPRYMGKFVLESISEERRFHTGLGVCQIAEATISLTECGDENAARS